MGLFQIWKFVLTNPKETFTAEKKNASFPNAIKHVAISGAIAGLFFTVMVVILGAVAISILPKGTNNLSFSALGLAGVFLLILYPLLFSLFATALSLVINAINFVLGKILGGKGSFSEQYYLYAIFTSPLLLINFLVLMIPIAGFFLIWLSGLFTVAYGVYLLYLSLKEAHQIPELNAVAITLFSLLIPIVAGVILSGK
ncbi:MAG: Yip1 family protein [Candidatus Micrarchaeota archaeon]